MSAPPETPPQSYGAVRQAVRSGVWCLLLVAFVLFGARNLQASRAEYNEVLLVLPGPAGSDDTYLRVFGLSSALLDDALAGIPIGEQMLFVRRSDSAMFQEFSILSYTSWPRQLYGVGCGEPGQPAYADFAPSTPVSTTIAYGEQRPIGSDGDQVQLIAPSTWLVRATPGRTWASFCP